MSLASLYGSDEQKKLAAWNNAAIVPGHLDLRRDCDGHLIRWSDYGLHTQYGWEIDHAHPVALGGIDHFSNLRARHYRGNASAGGLLGDLLGKLDR